MKASKKKVMFFVSTAGHVKGVRALASLVTGVLESDVSVLNFPDDLTFLSARKFSTDSLNQLQCSVWNTPQSTPAGGRAGGGLVFRGKLMLFNIAKRVFLPLSLALFYVFFVWGILTFGFSAIFGKQSKDGGLRFSISKSFILIKNLFPGLQRWFFARSFFTGLLRSQNLLFGIWGDNKISEELFKLFSVSRPDLIVLPEFNWGYKHHLIGCVARKFDIPILVVPYTMAGAEEWIASFKSEKNCRVSGFFRRLLSKSYPEWVALDGLGNEIILPVSWLSSCVSNKFNPVLPWVTNSASDVLVAVDNEFTKRFYTREGLDTSSWLVLGSLEEDVLFNTACSNESGKDKPFVLIALPPDQFGALDSSGLEFYNYKQLVSFLIESVSAAVGAQFDIVVALHPRTSRSDVGFLEEYNIVITREPVEGLIPSAFLYIAVSSATIRWAIAASVPVINFDVYHYNYADYDDCRGVIKVRESLALETILFRLFQDQSYYDECVRAQNEDARRYFKLDGLSQERILALIFSMVSSV